MKKSLMRMSLNIANASLLVIICISHGCGIITEGVLILDGPVEYITRRDESVTLNCEAEADPKPEVVWIFEGDMLIDSEKYHQGNFAASLRLTDDTHRSVEVI